MVQNFVFRIWWLIGAFTLDWGDASFVGRFQVMTFIGALVECVRRTVWSIIRVENEFFNNFEQYRDIIIIPPIKEVD